MIRCSINRIRTHEMGKFERDEFFHVADAGFLDFVVQLAEIDGGKFNGHIPVEGFNIAPTANIVFLS